MNYTAADGQPANTFKEPSPVGYSGPTRQTVVMEDNLFNHIHHIFKYVYVFILSQTSQEVLKSSLSKVSVWILIPLSSSTKLYYGCLMVILVLLLAQFYTYVILFMGYHYPNYFMQIKFQEQVGHEKVSLRGPHELGSRLIHLKISSR